MVLRTGKRSCNAIDMATAITLSMGSLCRVATAGIDELCRIEGVGVAKAGSIIAGFELGRRASVEPAPQHLTSSAAIAAVARPLLQGRNTERVVVMAADSSLKVIRVLPLTDGAKDRALLPIRDVLAAVLRTGASAFAVAHNHPSGDLSPSVSDQRITDKLQEAAATVELRFLDHVIVGETGFRSIG
jgi:DNA repair protein RadC